MKVAAVFLCFGALLLLAGGVRAQTCSEECALRRDLHVVDEANSDVQLLDTGCSTDLRVAIVTGGVTSSDDVQVQLYTRATDEEDFSEVTAAGGGALFSIASGVNFPGAVQDAVVDVDWPYIAVGIEQRGVVAVFDGTQPAAAPVIITGPFGFGSTVEVQAESTGFTLIVTGDANTVNVYNQNGGPAVQIIAGPTGSTNKFGDDVDVSGNALVVGDADRAAGRVHVYTRSGPNQPYTLQATIDSPAYTGADAADMDADGTTLRNFGMSVAISSNRIAVLGNFESFSSVTFTSTFGARLAIFDQTSPNVWTPVMFADGGGYGSMTGGTQGGNITPLPDLVHVVGDVVFAGHPFSNPENTFTSFQLDEASNAWQECNPVQITSTTSSPSAKANSIDYCMGTAVVSTNAEDTIDVNGVDLGGVTFIYDGCPGEAAEVVGDPHFTGFLGQLFAVFGSDNHDGEVYNIVSTPHLQYNGRFTRTEWHHKDLAMTFISEIGLQVGPSNRVRIVMQPDSEQVLLEVNGVEIAPDNLDMIQLGTNEWLQRTPNSSGRGIFIVTREFQFTVTGRLKAIPHLDDGIKLVDWDHVDTFHGLLGQTARPGRMQPISHPKEYNADFEKAPFLDGHVADYAVAGGDIFGTRFSYNKFVGRE